MKKRYIRILDYIGITIGTMCTALALSLFLVPNRIAAGGVSGLATVIYYLTGLPVGMTMLIINIPIFLAGVKYLGITFGTRTIYGTVVLSVFTDFFLQIVPPLTDDLLLASIYGGVLGGLGLGIVFRFKGSTGGTDIVARLINHFTGFSIGQGLLIADGVVVALAGIFFNIEVALYGAVTIFINSKTIDLVQEGLNISKMALIISDHTDKIKEEIYNRLDRGVTFLNGEGGYTGKDKKILLCIISRSEISEVKQVVASVEKNAFVIITDVNEVMGEGFTPIE